LRKKRNNIVIATRTSEFRVSSSSYWPSGKGIYQKPRGTFLRINLKNLIVSGDVPLRVPFRNEILILQAMWNALKITFN
jgi:hypothetical protein